LRSDTLELRVRVFPQTQLFAESQPSRFGREERVGATLDDEAIDVLGHDLAAEAILRLDERHPQI
jgi:hypothetical protein